MADATNESMVAFSDEAWAIIKQYAAKHGLTPEQAIDRLASQGLREQVLGAIGSADDG